MKTSNAIIIGSIILAISIFWGANRVASNLHYPAQFPSSLTVATQSSDSNTGITNDFISFHEASAYLRLGESKLEALIRAGKLNGTFTSFQESGRTTYIFSASKLTAVMNSIIDDSENLD